MSTPVDNTQADQYDGLGVVNSYEFRPGVCILPLAEDPPTSESELRTYSPVVVARLHAPYRVRKATYNAAKKNAPFPLPSPADTGSFVFLGGAVVLTNNLNATFRTFDWSGGSEYLFVENCVSRPEDGMVLGIPPFNWLSSSINAQSGYSAPPIGAVSHGGKDVLVGYTQGQQMEGNQGGLKDVWGYNTPSYYPGLLFYSDMLNGGEPVVPVSQG